MKGPRYALSMAFAIILVFTLSMWAQIYDHDRQVKKSIGTIEPNDQAQTMETTPWYETLSPTDIANEKIMGKTVVVTADTDPTVSGQRLWLPIETLYFNHGVLYKVSGVIYIDKFPNCESGVASGYGDRDSFQMIWSCPTGQPVTQNFTQIRALVPDIGPVLVDIENVTVPKHVYQLP